MIDYTYRTSWMVLQPDISLDVLIDPQDADALMNVIVNSKTPVSITVFEGVDVSNIGSSILAEAMPYGVPVDISASPYAISIGPTIKKLGERFAGGLAELRWPFTFGHTNLDPLLSYLLRVTTTGKTQVSTSIHLRSKG